MYHPLLKKNTGLINVFFYDEIPFGFFPENLDLNHFVHLNTMVVTIFDNKFIENLEWLDIKTTFGISITSYYLIDDKLVIGTSTLRDKTFGVKKKSGHVKCELSR